MADPNIQLFQRQLQHNALLQLQQSQAHLHQELTRYESPQAWDVVRQLHAKDQQLQDFQIQAVDNLTHFVEQNITHGKVVWSGTGFTFPASGSLQDRHDQLVKFLSSSPSWKQELDRHRPQLEHLIHQADRADLAQVVRDQLRQQSPALSVLSEQDISKQSNTALQRKLQESLTGALGDISKLRQDIVQDPSRALQLDLTVAHTLEEFKGDPAVIEWVRQERTKDGLIKGAGTVGTLALAGATVLLTKNPEVAGALGLGASATGAATALYELPQLETAYAASQAQLGGQRFTNTDREEAQRDLGLGRANVVLSAVDLGLPVLLRLPRGLQVISQLKPEQVQQVARVAQLQIAGKGQEAQTALQRMGNSQLTQDIKGLLQDLAHHPELGTPNNARPMPMRGGEAASAVIDRAQEYEVLRLEVNLPANVAQSLQEKEVAVDTVRALSKKGMQPEELNKYLGSFQNRGDYPHQNYGVEDFQKIASTLNQLGNRGMELNQAQKLLQISAKQTRALGAIEMLMSGKGMLQNPQELRELVTNINNGDIGKIQELEIAAGRVQKGHQMQLGAVHDPNLSSEAIEKIWELRRQEGKNPAEIKVNVGGDVVDLTTREVIQSKNVTSADAEKVWQNLREADKQLQGINGELPNPGFKKVAEIRIPSNNELFKLNSREFNNEINGRIQNNAELQDFDGVVRITKEAENKVTETLDFQVRAGKSQVLEHQNVRLTKISSLETTGLIAGAATLPAQIRQSETQEQPPSSTEPASNKPIQPAFEPTLFLTRSISLTERILQQPPQELLDLHAQVEQWKASVPKPVLSHHVQALSQQLEQLQQQHVNLTAENKQHAWGWKIAQMRGPHCGDFNPIRMDISAFSNARTQFNESTRKLEQVKEQIGEGHKNLSTAQQEADIFDRWTKEPHNKEMLSMAKQLKEPSVAEHIQGIQQTVRLFERATQAAQTLGRPAEHMAQLREMKVAYLSGQNDGLDERQTQVMTGDVESAQQQISMQEQFAKQQRMQSSQMELG
jgi:hypothetical protein